jgi:hypothetical protein
MSGDYLLAYFERKCYINMGGNHNHYVAIKDEKENMERRARIK